MPPSKDFTVADAGTEVVYLNGYPRYDAIRVEFDSANSGSTNTDLTYKVDTNDELGDVESNGFASMDYQVDSTADIDPSTGDPHDGTTALGRTVAVQIVEDDGVSNGGVEGTVYLHSSTDNAETADSFANR